MPKPLVEAHRVRWPRRLLLSAELQLEQLGEGRVRRRLTLLFRRCIEAQRRAVGIAPWRPRSAPLLARPLRVGPILAGPSSRGSFRAWTLAPAIVLAAVGPLGIGEELPLVGPLRPFAAPLFALLTLLLALALALLLALAHETRLHREGVQRSMLFRRRMDTIAESVQHFGHLRFRAADQRHHLRRGAEPTRRQGAWPLLLGGVPLCVLCLGLDDLGFFELGLLCPHLRRRSLGWCRSRLFCRSRRLCYSRIFCRGR